MTKQLVFVVALAVVGCTKPRSEPIAERGAGQPDKPPRTFSEKLQCATVGERWEKVMCFDERGRRNPLCTGWWAYNAKRGTRIGVFLTCQAWNRRGGLDRLWALETKSG